MEQVLEQYPGITVNIIDIGKRGFLAIIDDVADGRGAITGKIYDDLWSIHDERSLEDKLESIKEDFLELEGFIYGQGRLISSALRDLEDQIYRLSDEQLQDLMNRVSERSLELNSLYIDTQVS